MILIASHQRASEADRVIDVLLEAGVQFTRLNMAPGESSTALVVRSGCGPVLELNCDGRRIGMSDITSGWYHQPPILSGPRAGLGRASSVAVSTSNRNYWLAALEALTCTWFNEPNAVHRAGNKLRQIMTASRCGMPVPGSTSGDNLDAIRKTRRGETVAKNIADMHLVWEADQTTSLITRPVDVSSIAPAQVIGSPLLYQDQIHPVREYRVVMVSGDVFGSAVDWKDRAGAVDIRTSASASGARYAIDLPEATSQPLRLTLECLGLDFCSADLIEGPDQVIRLIDLNACGAWWEVDDLYDGAIARGIAAQLMAANESQGPADAFANS